MEVIRVIKDTHNIIFSLLEVVSLLRFSTTSRIIYEFSCDENYWKEKCIGLVKEEGKTWKELYLSQYTEIFGFNTYATSKSFHKFIQIVHKSNMALAVDTSGDIYSWHHLVERRGSDYCDYLDVPKLLENIPTKAKKVFNDGESISYIDVDGILWWSPSNPKYARPHTCKFRKMMDLRIKDFAFNYDAYFVIDLENNVWRGDSRTFYDVCDANLLKPTMVKMCATKIVVYERYLAYIDMQNILRILDYSKKTVLCKHRDVTQIVMDYAKAVFLDMKSRVWIYTMREKKEMIAKRGKCISFSAMIDLDGDVYSFGSHGTVTKLLGIKGIRLDSTNNGNCVVMGRQL